MAAARRRGATRTATPVRALADGAGLVKHRRNREPVRKRHDPRRLRLHRPGAGIASERQRRAAVRAEGLPRAAMAVITVASRCTSLRRSYMSGRQRAVVIADTPAAADIAPQRRLTTRRRLRLITATAHPLAARAAVAGTAPVAAFTAVLAVAATAAIADRKASSRGNRFWTRLSLLPSGPVSEQSPSGPFFMIPRAAALS